jgi:hypothetical protein
MINADRETNRAQEWLTMTALHEAGEVPLPQPVSFDPDGTGLGTIAMIMKAQAHIR